MKTHNIGRLYALLLPALFVGACGGSSSKVDAPQVMIVATGNVNGEIAPCG